MHWFYKILIGFFALFGLMAVLIFRPVPAPSETNMVWIEGTMKEIYEGPGFDIVFRLEDDFSVFYINRGLQYTVLTIDQLREDLVGKNVKFRYIDHWSLLNYNKQLKTIAHIEADGEVFFTRLKGRDKYFK